MYYRVVHYSTLNVFTSPSNKQLTNHFVRQLRFLLCGPGIFFPPGSHKTLLRNVCGTHERQIWPNL